MKTLHDFLELDTETPSEKRARLLARNDSDLLSDLVALRKSKKITQAVLAERLGLTQATIASFESYDSDPKLSTIRRYAHALGALVKHVVEADEGQYSNGETWHVLSFSLPSLSGTRSSDRSTTPSSTYSANAPKRTDFAVAA